MFINSELRSITRRLTKRPVANLCRLVFEIKKCLLINNKKVLGQAEIFLAVPVMYDFIQNLKFLIQYIPISHF